MNYSKVQLFFLFSVTNQLSWRDGVLEYWEKIHTA